MSTLTLRDLGDDLVAAIGRRAAANARTVEAEVECILRRAVSGVAETDDPWADVEQIAAMTPAGPQTDSVAMLREDRAR